MDPLRRKIWWLGHPGFGRGNSLFELQFRAKAVEVPMDKSLGELQPPNRLGDRAPFLASNEPRRSRPIAWHDHHEAMLFDPEERNLVEALTEAEDVMRRNLRIRDPGRQIDQMDKVVRALFAK